MKKVGMIVLTIAVGIFFLTGCGCKKREKEPEVTANTNTGVIEDQKVEVFTLTKTSLVYVDGTSTLETLVTNTSKEKQFLAGFKIHVKNNEGNDIVTLLGFVGDSIEAGQSKKFVSTYGADLTKASKVEYEIIKE